MAGDDKGGVWRELTLVEGLSMQRSGVGSFTLIIQGVRQLRIRKMRIAVCLLAARYDRIMVALLTNSCLP
jgi:hypothetical protein